MEHLVGLLLLHLLLFFIAIAFDAVESVGDFSPAKLLIHVGILTAIIMMTEKILVFFRFLVLPIVGSPFHIDCFLSR